MSNLLNSFQLILMRSPWLARIRLRRLRRRQSPRSLCQSRAKPEASLKQCSKTPSIEVKPLQLPVVCRTRFRRQVSVCHFTKELCPLVTLADNPLSIPFFFICKWKKGPITEENLSLTSSNRNGNNEERLKRRGVRPLRLEPLRP